jgi:hypothetical protein
MSSITRTIIRLLVVLLFLVGRAFGATALGSVTITGTEQSSGSTWDTGTVTATINGVVVSFAYGQFSTPSSIAAALGALISQDCNMPVYAQASGATLTFYKKGSNTITSASITIVSNNPSLFPSGSFQVDGGGSWTAPPVMVASNLNPSTYGSQVTFTATVTGNSSSGTVTFYDFNGAVTLGTSNLNSGMATWTISTLAPGAHTITAIYNGDPDNSNVLTQTVNRNTMTLPGHCVY